jgi:predicted transporter
MNKLKALGILFIILASLIPAYYLSKYLQKLLKPRESIGRLVVYMIAVMLLVFIYSFLLVLVIKWLFPNA